jgi:hypothetical protein
MSEAIHPLPHTPSWRGAQLKHRDNFTFTFTISGFNCDLQTVKIRINVLQCGIFSVLSL